ncbi:MAG: CPBP family glutamic-type intramembrane protease [Bacteroidota bacterium]
MININFKNLIIVLIACIVQFGLRLLDLNSKIIVWEIEFDLVLFILVYLYLKYIFIEINFKKSIQDNVSLKNIKQLLFYFFIPFILIAIVLLIGLSFNEIKLTEDKNIATNILALVLDFPAVLVFSIFTIFIEEYFFRLLFFNNLVINSFKRILLSSLFFGLYFTLANTNLEFNIYQIVISFLFAFSIGLSSIIVFRSTGNLLSSYLFRIGILTSFPILLNSFDDKSFSLFETSSNIFLYNGLVSSLFLMLFAIFTNLKLKKNKL